MSNTHSTLIIILLAVIASVLLFGADAVKAHLWIIGIVAAVVAFVGIAVFAFALADNERSQNGVGWWVFPMLLASSIAVGVFGWSYVQAYREGTDVYAVLGRYPLLVYAFFILFFVAMLVRLVEGWRTIPKFLKKGLYFLIAPAFSIQGAQERIRIKREAGNHVSATSAFLTIMFSFCFSILLSIIAIFGVLICFTIIWTIFNPS